MTQKPISFLPTPWTLSHYKIRADEKENKPRNVELHFEDTISNTYLSQNFFHFVFVCKPKNNTILRT